MNDALDASYQHCHSMTRRAASSFYWSFWLLPRHKRRAMCALYSFSRHTDDLGDSAAPLDERRAALDAWRDDLAAAWTGEFRHPLLPALCDTVHQFRIPRDCLSAIIDGVAMDLQPRRYGTFEELCVYCYRVASAVGLACVHVWGYSSDEVFAPAVQCGYAFQLTNILRDVREDAQLSRVYLPEEDLRRFSYGADELARGVYDQRCIDLMEFETNRASRLYDQAADVARHLHPDGRRSFSMMFRTYRGLLDEIRRRRGNVFQQRVRLPMRKRLAIAAATLVYPTLVAPATVSPATLTPTPQASPSVSSSVSAGSGE